MIDEKKLIEELEAMPFIHDRYDHKNGNPDFISGIETWHEIVLNKIEQQPKVMEWIPVTERLPCKIGDKAWCIRNRRGIKKATQNIVTEMFYRKDMKLIIVVHNVGRGILGEKVFLTQEEAEQALREKGEGV